MKFTIEQLALCPINPDAATELLTAMGAGEWARDHVHARGEVFGQKKANEADLAFEYEMLKGAKELEVLNYTEGDNWMDQHGPSASHIGMHCSAEELAEWRRFFADRGIKVAQEVLTTQHSNPTIQGQRWYNYVIFDTRDILSVDVKFIVRKDHAPTQ